jgi:hypothetical protein
VIGDNQSILRTKNHFPFVLVTTNLRVLEITEVRERVKAELAVKEGVCPFSSAVILVKTMAHFLKGRWLMR